ncbi:MAG: NTP transferase domain-containing protein [Planctomycetaceae bacterium]|jgi:UTP--glucose-1-phosphate uridylyltransferase|nr:NTP transferase domain-containing protein [Planctomycetaceae bacterium]
MINIGVIPVAGRGLSLLPITKSQPKEMLPVGGKPIVQYVVDELIRCEVNRLLFVTGPGKSSIEDHFDINKELIRFLRYQGLEDSLSELAFEREHAAYFYTRQRYQNGLGQAVLCAEPYVNGHRFVVALGDTILGRHTSSGIVGRLVDVFDRGGGEVKGVIAFDEVLPSEVSRFGIAVPGKLSGDCFELLDLVEKPHESKTPSCLAVAARYVFSPDIFEYLHKTKPDANGDIQLTDAIHLLLQDGKRVIGVRLPQSELRYDIGDFESYYKAFIDFAIHDPIRGNEIRDYLKNELKKDFL